VTFLGCLDYATVLIAVSALRIRKMEISYEED
jgi:hypothetical protein